jgi:hypothetical protein
MSIRLQPVDLGTVGLFTPTTRQVNNTAGGLDSSAKVLATPLEALTTETLEGKGVFDVLMRTVKLHLKDEFDAQRITGSEYTDVFLGALTAVLQTSAQFLLNEQQVQKLNADIGLVRQQTATELSNTDDSIPIGLAHNFIPDVPVTIPPVSGGA